MSRVKNLEDELIASLAEEMQKTMDFEVMCELFVPFGWTRVATEHQGGQEWKECVWWAKRNCTGDYREHNGVWLFENKEDATMFALKWI